MTLSDLIEKAVEAKGTRAAVAEGLGMDKQRLTDWKAGRRTPDANEIAYLAKCAGLPVLQTVGEIESQLNSKYASIWREALGKLTAAGVAATVGAVMVMSPQNANASPSQVMPRVNHCVLCKPMKANEQIVLTTFTQVHLAPAEQNSPIAG